MTREPPVTFFSYAWTTEAHKARVRALANRLRTDAVDVILDQTHLQPGDDTFHFMEQIANRADLKKVVVICDAAYKRKVDNREGGSGTEGSIMSPEVYRQFGEGPNKYVAVAFETDEQGGGFVPTMFATRLYIDMSTDTLVDQNYDSCGTGQSPPCRSGRRLRISLTLIPPMRLCTAKRGVSAWRWSGTGAS